VTHWESNTLLLWDNWATLHHAVWDYFPEERWAERVSACLEHGPQARVRAFSKVTLAAAGPA
jgi:taurine dioxygenase